MLFIRYACVHPCRPGGPVLSVITGLFDSEYRFVFRILFSFTPILLSYCVPGVFTDVASDDAVSVLTLASALASALAVGRPRFFAASAAVLFIAMASA